MLGVLALAVYGGVRVRRAREAHRARSEERAATLLREMNLDRKSPPAGSPAPAPQPFTPLPAITAAAPPSLVRKPRFLSEPQRLLYLLARAALTDHIVMANVRLADLVEASDGAAQRARLQDLLQERADCLVCTNDLIPVAALVVYDSSIERVPDERIKIEALRELGVRFLRFRSGSLPRPAEMRALVLG